MHPRYQDLSTADLARLTEENLYGFLTALADNCGDCTTTSHLVRYSDPLVVSPMFNGVVRSNIPSEAVDTTIRETIDYFVSRQRPMAFWWIGPSTQPTDLGKHLQTHGLAAFETNAPAMAVDLHALPQSITTPPGFTIDIVDTADDARIWADTFNTIYGTPSFAGQAWHDAAMRAGFGNAPFRLYLGRLDGRPVATNMLTWSAGVASVLGVGTLPEVRGRGIGAAITLRPYLDARDMDYNTGVLFSTEAGLPVYRRLGFREVGAISRYLWRKE